MRRFCFLVSLTVAFLFVIHVTADDTDSFAEDDISGRDGDAAHDSDTAMQDSDTVQDSDAAAVEDPNPEMTNFESAEHANVSSIPMDDPLDADETNETLAVIGAAPIVENDVDDTSADVSVPLDVEDLLDRFRPYGKGDMELSIGMGGSGAGGGFTLSAGALFAYYVVNRLAPGIEISYLAHWGDVKYPQSLTLFPFLKFVLIRSHRFAPYLLAGGGRTMAWGGGDGVVDSDTGDFSGIRPVGSWVVGMGGGFMIGIGARMRIQIQLLAMFRAYDETVMMEPVITQISYIDANGALRVRYTLEGDEVNKIWYPAPSFWFSFAL